MQNIAVNIPAKDSTQGVEPIMGKLMKTTKPLADMWIEQSIISGRIPRVMEHVHVSFEFRVSLQTALELGATLWDWPDITANKGMEEKGIEVKDGKELQVFEMQREAIPFAKRIYFKDEQQAGDIAEALIKVQDIVHGLLDKYPKDVEIARSCLPVTTMVTTIVTKSLIEWRNFLMSDSSCYEAFYLKKCLFEKFNAVVPCLFIGCEQVIKAFKRYQQLTREG